MFLFFIFIFLFSVNCMLVASILLYTHHHRQSDLQLITPMKVMQWLLYMASIATLLYFGTDFSLTCEGMEIHTLVSTLLTRCMDLGCTVSQMDINMKVHGTRAGDKAWECTHSGMGRHNQVTGKMVSLKLWALRALILGHQLLLTIQKYWMQFRWYASSRSLGRIIVYASNNLLLLI